MNPKQEITDLTACRALFAAWVFIYHVDLHAQFAQYLGPAANLIRHGYLGVDGFFILSGLILSRVRWDAGKNMQNTWRFWGRRLARIYPVHLAVILLLGVFVLTGAAMGVAPRDPSRFGVVALLENLLLLQGWGFGNAWTWNYPSWTISTEWAGYIVFPFFCRLLYGQFTMVSGQIALLCIPLLALLAYNSGHDLNIADGWLILLRFFIEFLFGVAAARLVAVFADFMPNRGFALAGAVITLLSATRGLDFIAVIGLGMVLLGLTMHADAERKPLLRRLPWLRAFGLLSYAFYMSFATAELLLAQGFRHFGWEPSAHKLLYAGLMTGLTFALALVLHVLVENPCRQWADSRLGEPKAKPRRRKGPPPQSVPGTSPPL